MYSYAARGVRESAVNGHPHVPPATLPQCWRKNMYICAASRGMRENVVNGHPHIPPATLPQCWRT